MQPRTSQSQSLPGYGQYSAQYSTQYSAQYGTQHGTNSQSAAHNTLMGSLIIILPLLFVCGIALRRKHRIATLHRQINTLERLWKIDTRGIPEK